MHIVLHPSFRGAVSGIGVLDILLAVGWIGARPGPDSVPPR
jgi:ABC-type ATPase with predicted acetyltransferase domain